MLLNYRLGSHLYYRTRKTTKDRVALNLLQLLQVSASRILGCYLPFRAQIGARIVLPHSLHGIFITQRAILGDDVTLYQNVTIGSDFLSRNPAKQGAPTIGNDVIIGAGAIVVGKVRIGHNARIGAGAVVTRNVPDHGVAYSPGAVIREGAEDVAPPSS